VRVALGLKAHSGWAALVALGGGGGDLRVVDRHRIELVQQADASWARQPYHAAEGLKPAAGREVVRRGVAGARRAALAAIRLAVRRARDAGHDAVAGAVLVGDPMPAWSVDEILAVHFRMHKAEGVLFRDVLLRAVKACGLRVVAVPEKRLMQDARRILATPAGGLVKTLGALGRSVGPPWGKDQKEAALAAMIALQGRNA
jgi:hypothetical protein